MTGTLPGEPDWTPEGERYLYDAAGQLCSLTQYHAPQTVGGEEFFEWQESRRLSVQYLWPTPDFVKVNSVAEARFADDGRLLFTQRVWAVGGPPTSFELTWDEENEERVRSVLWCSVDEDNEERAIETTVDYSYSGDGEIDRLIDRDSGEVLFKRRGRIRRLGRSR